ncbi:MAG: helix-turn-helix transcriptional regulator [Tyzzerella sp.]|nr:helix-turn-helix transcriptional regulator [Tyzzerella sp.]
MDRIILGKRIREERQKLNLTQEVLAEDIDLTTSYVGQIERGERNLTLECLVRVSNRLGVTVDYLLSDSLSVSQDTYLTQVAQLLNGKSLAEKEMAVDILKTLFRHVG